MKCRFGQISIFVIISFIMVLILIFLISLNKSETSNLFLDSSQDDKLILVKDYTENCLNEIGLDAVFYVSSNGGYFLLNDSYNYYAIYINNQTLITPTKNQISDSISGYIKYSLFSCLENFENFKIDNTIIEYYLNDVKTTILDDKVKINLDMPIIISKNNYTSTISNFEIDLDVNLNNIYNLMLEIENNQMENLSRICLSCINNFTYSRDLQLKMEKLKYNYISYKIIDNSTLNNDNFLEFNFLNILSTYNFLNKEIENETELYVENISDQKIKAGKIFYYKVKAIGTNLSYYDYSHLFNINSKNGEIQFETNDDMIGNYSIDILINDQYKNSKLINFNLEVEE